MSDYGDSLRAAYEQAIAGAARVLASIGITISDANARGGPEEIARTLRPNGTDEERAQIAAHHELLITQQAPSRRNSGGSEE